ncbi:hypothetical protein [Vreelandella azerica]|uniref:hypothetical protein n=1 Tax=Vreelandella azerica TaxID=2732867 RepID=UPI002E2DE299|nr:hypothetical protein [Halomonas azerica]
MHLIWQCHAFISFILEPEIAAEITEYVYANPNAAADEFLPEDILNDRAIATTMEKNVWHYGHSLPVWGRSVMLFRGAASRSSSRRKNPLCLSAMLADTLTWPAGAESAVSPAPGCLIFS